MNEKIDINLVIDIDCYQCGNNLFIPFRFGVQQAEYTFCPQCQEGIAIESSIAGTLRIRRAEALGEK